MITRKRAHNTVMQPLQVAEVNVLETVEDLRSPCEGAPTADIDEAGIDLDELFGMEELKWTLEGDAVSPLFDDELADLGVYSAKDHDSDHEASTGSSPERMSSDSKKRNRQSHNVINKNAIAARLNRLKKKEYVNSLEKKVGVLSTENVVLKEENSQLTRRVEELEDETRAPTQMTMTTRCPGSV
ncbi:CREB/ATF bZIP transcription factor [Parambassis ranga]|uniref:CREB/ATF bZIP transcription factor n=1 Tax=Parambassis ranga TaxID=210632 RepID=A0A6P7IKU1_9TELE|nr:CREB/ATF bZIP transcription factor [Parambassis ranga]